jgi:hypothetical protein
MYIVFVFTSYNISEGIRVKKIENGTFLNEYNKYYKFNKYSRKFKGVKNRRSK